MNDKPSKRFSSLPWGLDIHSEVLCIVILMPVYEERSLYRLRKDSIRKLWRIDTAKEVV